MVRRYVPLVLLLAVGLLVLLAATRDDSDEQLRQRINLGKAFYENPTTQAQAVDEFAKALQLNPDSPKEQLNYALALLRAAKTPEAVKLLQKVQQSTPSLPHTWWNLGIVYKREGNPDEALRELSGFIRLVQNEPISHYNLGVLHKLKGETAAAIAEFETAAKLDDSLAAPHFQLYNAYRQAGRAADAARELASFQNRKKMQDGSGVPEDMEWNGYSEIYEPIPALPASLQQPLQPTFTSTVLAEPGSASGAVALDVDGDGKPDLLTWSAAGTRTYLNATSVAKQDELDGLAGVTAIVPGDFNNDGLVDLCVLTKESAVLFENRQGVFHRVDAKLPAGSYTTAAWLDFDHDYDLDLLLFGAQPTLLRNQGTVGFVPHSESFPFAAGNALHAVAFRQYADSKAKDLLVSYSDHAGVLYRDDLTGKYTAVPLDSLPAGATDLTVVDFDNNSQLDALFVHDNQVQWLRNEKGQLAPAAMLQAGASVGLADVGNRGRQDLLAGGKLGQNQGQGKLLNVNAALPDAAQWISADWDGDGRTDLLARSKDGSLTKLINTTPTKNRWLRVQLKGIKNLKLAGNAEVEVKAGASYQKLRYQGLPLTFGVGPYQTVDTVRITWPNGLIQNEMKQASGRLLRYEEAQRLSGSCPLIYTWNGREFEYITDVLGVAPLGAMSGDGEFFPTDHDEYVFLQGKSLTPRDGQYEIRVTEELSEVSYLDQLQLIAVDHPAGTDVFTNEKWKSPPFPEFRLFGVAQRLYPRTALDDQGRDHRDQLLRRDHSYVDGFARDFNGVAARHALTLDFGPAAARDNRAVLVLNGWVDWADGSTFLSQAQEGKGGLQPPSLQVRDARGQWRTVIEDMGMPSGKPKTISVDLTGKFLSASREVRIVTNLCVFWDEVFLGEDSRAPEARLTKLNAAQADVRFRGFSRSTIHPQRKQPEQFDYARPTMTSYWNPTPGFYTRYGDVAPLVHEADDRLVVLGSGDEVRLRYPAQQLPVLPQGWTRDFLLLVDGWAKDRDANTAFSQTVEPLPFHAMTRYPYPAGERYPEDALHRTYREQYNTRPALRLLRPLTE